MFPATHSHLRPHCVLSAPPALPLPFHAVLLGLRPPYPSFANCPILLSASCFLAPSPLPTFPQSNCWVSVHALSTHFSASPRCPLLSSPCCAYIAFDLVGQLGANPRQLLSLPFLSRLKPQSHLVSAFTSRRRSLPLPDDSFHLVLPSRQIYSWTHAILNTRPPSTSVFWCSSVPL